jgi:hypothetical protein
MGPRRLPFRIRMVLGGILLGGGLASWHPTSDALRGFSSHTASFFPPAVVKPDRRPSAAALPSGWAAQLTKGDNHRGGRGHQKATDNRTASETPDGEHANHAGRADDSSIADSLVESEAEAIDSGPAAPANFDVPGFPWQPSWGLGQSLRTEGRAIHVAGFQPVPGATAPALDALITEEPAQRVPTAIESPRLPGFTSEEALFRMRWGWAAHEAARRAAREEQF